MSDATSSITPNNEEINVLEALRILWKGKWVICGVSATATIISIIVALSLPNIYRAEAVLTPTEQNEPGGLSSLAGEYGVLANLAGFNLANVTSDRTDLGLEVLKSRKFISDFIERHDILVPLMAAEGWDSSTGELRIDPKIYDVSSNQWVRNVRPPRKTVPSRQETYERFIEKVLRIVEDDDKSIITVAIEHYSPTVAKQWVDWLVEDINETIMLRDVAEAEQAIKYLNKQIQATSLAGLQSVFFRLIEEQTKTIMLANISSEYFLQTIDPAVVPEDRERPRRFLIVLFSLLLGGFVGVIVVSVMHRYL